MPAAFLVVVVDPVGGFVGVVLGTFATLLIAVAVIAATATVAAALLGHCCTILHI